MYTFYYLILNFMILIEQMIVVFSSFFMQTIIPLYLLTLKIALLCLDINKLLDGFMLPN